MTLIPFGHLPTLRARTCGEAIAVQYPDGVRTWAELDHNASLRAAQFADAGARRGDFAIVGLPNGVAFHEATFALWKLGVTPTIVSAKLPASEFAAIVDLVRPRLVVGADAQAVSGIPQVSAAAPPDADRAVTAAVMGRYWKAMSSGGSTGRPKIIVDHGPCAWDPDANLAQAFGMTADSVVLNPGPLYHNAPFLFSHVALFNGCRLVGMDRFDAEEALRLIEAHRVTWVNLVPTMMHRIWSLPAAVRDRYDISSLQTVWHMAAPCPPWLKEAWIDWLGGEKIFELYGGTEGYGTAIIRGDEWLIKRGSVGRMSGEARIKAVREDGVECAPGEVGELFFLPPKGAEPSHYIGAEAKVSDGGWRSIGDLGHIDGDGYVFLADRRTDLILRGGANIYPAEVEAALDAHPQVASSLVIGLPCDELGQRVHAIVQPKPNAALDITELHTFLKAQLTRYKLPESYEVSGQALRDDAGKARRSAVRDERLAWLGDGTPFRTIAGA